MHSSTGWILNVCVDVIANGEKTLGPVRLQSRNPWDRKEHRIIDLVVYRFYHSYVLTSKTRSDNWYNFKTINFQERLIPKGRMMTPWPVHILNWLTIDCKWLAMPSNLRCKTQARGAWASSSNWLWRRRGRKVIYQSKSWIGCRQTIRAGWGVVGIFTGNNGEIVVNAKGKARERGWAGEYVAALRGVAKGHIIIVSLFSVQK